MELGCGTGLGEPSQHTEAGRILDPEREGVTGKSPDIEGVSGPGWEPWCARTRLLAWDAHVPHCSTGRRSVCGTHRVREEIRASDVLPVPRWETRGKRQECGKLQSIGIDLTLPRKLPVPLLSGLAQDATYQPTYLKGARARGNPAQELGCLAYVLTAPLGSAPPPWVGFSLSRA